MNDASALRLASLHVRKMPGIPDGFELSGLSDRVTIVFGPNGSGKTSTARAIEAVLWPRHPSVERLSAWAEYSLGESSFRVELDAGHVAVQCDGRDARAPELPAPDFRHRYRLSLHELIGADGSDFAEAIRQESAGGYDLTAAATALGFRGKASGSRAETNAVEQAKAKLSDARQAQAALQGKARELGELERRLSEAHGAREREGVLSLAARHARAVAVAENAERVLVAFPAALVNLRGDEHERLSALRGKMREADAAIRDARIESESSASQAAALLGVAAPTPDVLQGLHESLAVLQRCERDVAQYERELAEGTGRQADARRALGGSALVSDDQLSRIDAVTFGELSEFAREVERARAQADAVEAELRLCADAEAPVDLDVVRTGSHLLGSWLSEGDGGVRDTGNSPAPLWMVAVLAVIAWGLHAARWHWAFALLAMLALVIAVLGTRRRQAADDPRDGLQREYERLALQRPAAWRAEDVRALLDVLRKRLADGVVAAKRSEWRDLSAGRRDELAKRMRALDERGAQLAARFGVVPDTDQRQLSWLADRIGHWQKATLDVAGSRAALDAALGQCSAALARISGRLLPYGYEQLETSAEVKGAIDALENRVREHEDALRRGRDARRRIEELGRGRETAQNECEEILKRAGASDDAEVEALCARFEEYVEARNAHDFAVRDRDSARADLEAASGYEPELADRALSILESDGAEANRIAGEADSLTRDVAVVRDAVERAKHASDVETAVAELADARAALQLARERDLDAVIGDLVMRHVQQATRDQNRPEVFHRARELFARITRGRYRLDFAEGDAPSFRAFDETTGVGQALGELSSGTRVQLALAVRVAFVETQEQGVRLPLLLDETLGTSDDQRASAIIDAVMTLAEDGRQVFYFTAQQDELGKWVAALTARGMRHTLIDLSAARGQRPTSDGAPLAIADVRLSEVPEPGDCTHDDYGALLKVPALRPGRDALGATPLWYVVDDPDALCHVLRLGITSWGALQNLIERGGQGLLDGYPRIWPRASALARALGALQTEAAIGLGRPVDRAALLDSGAVSDVHMDNMVALAERCGGRAGALIAALGEGEIQRFQKRKISELSEYLAREGYLDERTVRTSEELRTAMIVAAGEGIATGTLVPKDIDDLLHRIELRRSPLESGLLSGHSAQPASRAVRISEG